MESMALEVYHLPPYTPKEKMMEELKDRGIYYWNESLQVLKTIDALNLPLNLRKRNELFKQYVQLQLDSYNLLYQDLLHNSKQNDPQIKQDTHKIEHLMKELND
jgi:rhomboid protease GluP